MTISEMIAVLQDRMAVHRATYEGIQTSLDPASVYMSKSGELYIDADAEKNFCKAEFAVNPREGE